MDGLFHNISLALRTLSQYIKDHMLIEIFNKCISARAGVFDSVYKFEEWWIHKFRYRRRWINRRIFHVQMLCVIFFVVSHNFVPFGLLLLISIIKRYFLHLKLLQQTLNPLLVFNVVRMRNHDYFRSSNVLPITKHVYLTLIPWNVKRLLGKSSDYFILDDSDYLL